MEKEQNTQVVEKEKETETTENEVEIKEEFTENEQTTTTPDTKDDKTKQQDKKTNAEYAQKRREKEQLETQRKEIERQAELRGIRKALPTNPFTDEPMATDEDVEMYLMQKEMEKEGLDPNSLKDYKTYQAREKEKQAKITQKDDFLKKDSDDFVKKYPDIKADELFKEPRFIKFSKGKLGNIPLTEIYEDYQELVGEIDTRAKEMANKRVAKQIASPGDLKPSGASTAQETLYSLDELKKMTQQEVSENYDRVMKSLGAIRKAKKII